MTITERGHCTIAPTHGGGTIMTGTSLPLGAIANTWIAKGLNVQPVPDSLMVDVHGVRGFLIPGDIQFLWNAGMALPPGGRYLEVGSWLGLSGITVANALLANLNFDARVHCVDQWNGAGGLEDQQEARDGTAHDTFRRNVTGAGMDRFIEAIVGPSVDVAAQFEPGTLDAVFIDGDHGYEGYAADLDAWYPKVKQGGRIFGHDALPDQDVGRAVNAFAAANGLEVRVNEPPAAHYMWELVRSH